MVSAVAEHAQEVSDLVEDLLVAARVELGQVQVANLPVDMVHQVHQIISAGGSFTHEVDFHRVEGEPRAVCDPGRFRQIVRNLLTNAERYGGPNVSIGVAASDGLVRVDVVDDGPGLPPEEWERIFEPYHRAHETPGQPGSVGIGLAISRQLAQLMGGGLEYHCGEGGSIFRLSLPSAP